MSEQFGLRCSYKGETIFSSNSNWLYPIFELEEFLKTENYQNKALFVEDKIVGLAAANLFIYLGFGKIYAKIISKPAFFLLDKHNLIFSYTNVIEKVNCETEMLLADIDQPEEAYKILKERANR